MSTSWDKLGSDTQMMLVALFVVENTSEQLKKDISLFSLLINRYMFWMSECRALVCIAVNNTGEKWISRDAKSTEKQRTEQNIMQCRKLVELVVVIVWLDGVHNF